MKTTSVACDILLSLYYFKGCVGLALLLSAIVLYKVHAGRECWREGLAHALHRPPLTQLWSVYSQEAHALHRPPLMQLWSVCGTCHMASTFMPHSRTATATVCSTSSLLLLGFTLSLSFHFYCCKRLLGRNNTATASAPHERCQHLLRGALLLSCSVTNLRLF